MTATTSNAQVTPSNDDMALFNEFMAFKAMQAASNEVPVVEVTPPAPVKPVIYEASVVEGDETVVNGAYMLVTGVNNVSRRDKRQTVNITVGPESDRKQHGKSWIDTRITAEVADLLFGKHSDENVNAPTGDTAPKSATSNASKSKTADKDAKKQKRVDKALAKVNIAKSFAENLAAETGNVVAYRSNGANVYHFTDGKRIHIDPATGERQAANGGEYNANDASIATWRTVDKYVFVS